MSMTATPTQYRPGDRVTVDSPKYAGITFTVERQLQKNYRLIADGTGRGLRCAPELMSLATTGTGAPGGSQPPVGVPYEAPLDEGTLVLLRGKPGLFVVLRVTNGARTTYSVVKLGGDQGRYFRRVGRSHLTVVKLTSEVVEEVK